MIFKKNSLLISGIYILIFFIAVASCNRVKQPPPPPESKQISFKSIQGINYTEVRRRLNTGYSFDNQGFQTEPGYKITFLDHDSASVYSPDKQAFINFYVFMEKDSIFNVARSYFKMKHMSKDSLVLQVLDVEGDTLHTLHSLVYMTFYANNYIKSKHLDLIELGKPDRRDTVFIQKKSAIANKIPDSAFAARQPVELKSKSPLLTVKRTDVQPDVLNNFDASDAYMNPEFDITLNKAYEDFSYSFSVFVDDKGRLYFGRSMNAIMPEYKVSTEKTIKGIIDGYLTAYLKVTPGTTLGIKHTSWIILNVQGKK